MYSSSKLTCQEMKIYFVVFTSKFKHDHQNHTRKCVEQNINNRFQESLKQIITGDVR